MLDFMNVELSYCRFSSFFRDKNTWYFTNDDGWKWRLACILHSTKFYAQKMLDRQQKTNVLLIQFTETCTWCNCKVKPYDDNNNNNNNSADDF